MLSYGKYQTSQLSSNITYVPRIYAQNFLAYSSMDDLLIFIEPKHQIHVYSAQTIQLIVNISTTDVVIASSCQSLISESPHELFFIYMNHSLTNLIGLRVCQVQFNIYKLNFIPNYCIELIKLQYDQPNLRLYGFTIKRDHAGTDKSLLFISTEIGIIYAIFETRTGVLSNEPLILNETLNEGSIVLSASNSIYYASKQEHLIYELRITRDFHLYYGNITKTNAIKSPFGLVADECNHLYIATRSMILIMYAQASVTIRSVFSKASDLPITLERLNATTYVYATIKRHSTKSRPYWMFNFLYFIGKKPEKNLPATRHPVFNLDDKLDVDIRTINEANIPVLYPLSYSLLSMTNATKIYTQFSSTQRQPFARFRKKKKLNTDQRNNSDEQEKSTTIRNDLSLNEQSKSDLPDEFQSNDFDDDLENIDDSQFDFPEPTTTPIIDEENQSEPTTEPATLENDSNKRKNLTSSHDESQEQSSDEQLISNQLTTTTINPQETRFPDTDLSQYFKTNENLSLRDKELLYNYLTKYPSSDSKSLNDTFHIGETLFTKNDLQSYLEGRTNLSQTQIAQIQNYLAQQLSSDPNRFLKNITSTKRPRIHDDHQHEQDQQGEDYLEELLPLDPTYLNSTKDLEKILFTIHDLRAYLQGNENLSPAQQKQIEAYLERQFSLNRTIFSKHPISENTHDAEQNTKLKDFLKKIPLINSTYFNITTDSEQVFISKDDLQSYLQGQGNLSKTQEAQIQAYLAKQSASDQNIFSKYLTSTNKPKRPLIPGTNIYSDLESEGDQSEELLPLDLTHFNQTTHEEKLLFTTDDLKSYLKGRGNLSLAQQKQIEAYLERQSALNQTIFSKNPLTTKRPTIPFTSDEDIMLENLLNKMPVVDSKYYNISTNSEKILIPKDDLKLYLQGRGNLSKIQEAQVQTYIAEQSPSDQYILSKYLTSTVKPKTEEDHSFITDTHSKTYTEEELLSDLDYFERTTNSEERSFTIDDLRSYLLGHGNLSLTQKTQIEQYLAKQSPSNQNIFSKYLTTTTASGTIHDNYQNRNRKLEELLNKIPLVDSKYYNISTNTEHILIPKDDLKLYLQGQGNLSKIHEEQVKAYLAKQSLSDQKIFSSYFSSTKRPTENTEIDDYSDEVLPSDSTHLNHTITSEENLFSYDDLRSYLQGRGNFSDVQKAQIQAYLDEQSSSGQNIFSKFLKTTKPTTRIYSSDDRIPHDSTIEDKKLEDLLDKIPMIDSKHFNFSTELEQILISKDDLRSYLQGRQNLSKTQEEQVKAYFAKQSESDQEIFSQYLTSTIRPRTDIHPDLQSEDHSQELFPLDLTYFNNTEHPEKILFTVDDMKAHLQGQGNLTEAQKTQIEAYLIRQAASNQSLFSKYSTSTKPTTTIRSLLNNIYDDYQNDNPELQDFLDKLPQIDFNFSTGSEQILISKDDLRSYLQGKGNLSKAQEAQIEAYLATQTTSNQSISLEYLKTIKKPKDESYRNQSRKLEEFLNKIPMIDSKHFNISTGSEQVFISKDDLRSYLQGRGNLSKSQEAQIEAYLSRQAASNQSIFSKYSTTIKPTNTIHSLLNNMYDDYQNDNTELQDFLDKLPQTDSKYFNFSTGSEQILISKDDFTSYLQGRSNLTEVQKSQIEAYLATQLPSNQSISLEYLKTNKSRKLEEFLNKIPMIDSKHFNISTGSEQVFISKDDLRSYLQGRGNLTEVQKEQIEVYLARQAASNQSIFFKYSTSTKPTTTMYSSHDNIYDDYQNDNTELQDFLDKLPQTNSNYFNFSTGSQQILISKDDLTSYLQGRGNLTEVQKAQIEAYLATQLPSNQSISLDYLKTNKSRKLEEFLNKIPMIDSRHFNISTGSEQVFISKDDLRSYLQGRGNLTEVQKEQIEAYFATQTASNQSIFSEYLKTTKKPKDEYYRNQSRKLEDFLNKIPMIDSKHFNISTGSEQVFISKDDLRSYLQGRKNLSKIEEEQVKAYLAKQSESGQEIFSKFLTSTIKPRRPLIPGMDPQSDIDEETDDIRDENEEEEGELSPLDLTYFNNTAHPEKILFTVDDLKAHLQGQGNLTEAQQAQIEAYLARQSSSNQSNFSKYSKSTERPSKLLTPNGSIHHEYETDDPKLTELINNIPLVDSKYYNISTNTEYILIPKDDLKLYLQGRGNLSKTQEAEIQAYISKQSPSDQNILSKYLTSTVKPRRPLIPGTNIYSDSQEGEDQQIEDNSEEILPFDPEYFNHTTDSQTLLFTADDLRSYLLGRKNLSQSQTAQIEEYLAKQAAVNRTVFSIYSKSTKRPTKIIIPDKNLRHYYENGSVNLEKMFKDIPFTDSKYFNFSTSSEQILISKDDLRSYLQGRKNLSKIQEEQVKAYLAKLPESDQNIFSKLFTSTIKPRRPLLPGADIHSDLHSEEDHSQGLLPLDLTYFNNTEHPGKILFTVDNLKAHLQGQGNLTEAQKAQIQAYLARQAASNQSIFSKYSTTNKPTTTMYSSHDNIYDDYQSDNTELQDFLDKLPQTDSNYFNFSTGSEQILISKDDFTSYLQGRGNLTEIQKEQIEAYLATQSPSNQSMSLEYLKTTKKPKDENYRNQSRKLEDLLDKVPMIDSKHFNISTGSEQVFISKDDLRSYLQGRGNLTEAQKAQIEAYFATQQASNQSIFSEYLKTTKKPKDENDRNQSRKLEDFLNKIPMIDSKHFNISTGSEKIFISKDDLRSYLQGRKNLSKIQEEQIKAYFEKQSESDQEIFSKFLTSTIKPRRPLLPGRDPQHDIDEETGDILDENEEGELLPLDLTYFNDTKNPGGILFNVDDLRSYLGGRGKLTEAQQAQIEAYLARQSSSNQSIFSKYSKTTRRPSKIFISDDNTYDDDDDDDLSQEIDLEDALNRIPIIDSKYFNFSTDSEKILISKDDLRAYLQGRTNLSKSQEVGIQTYLTKHTSVGNDTLFIFNATLTPAHRLRLWSQLFPSPSYLSTRSPKFTRLSSRKVVSEKTRRTTMSRNSNFNSTDSSAFTSTIKSPHKFSSKETMDGASTLHTAKQKLITTTSGDTFWSSSLRTHRSRSRSTTSSGSLDTSRTQSSKTISDQYTSKPSKDRIESSSSYRKSSEIPFNNDKTISTIVTSTLNPHGSSPIISEKTSAGSIITSTDKYNRGISDYRPWEVNEKQRISSTVSPWFTDKYHDGFNFDRSSFRSSTMYPYFYDAKTSSTFKQSFFDLYDPLSTTPERRYRTRKQKVIRWRTLQSSTSSPLLPVTLTTSIHDDKLTTSNPLSTWHSERTPLEQQQTIIIKPPITKNDSNIFFSNDYLNQIFQNLSALTNSSDDKFIYLNLIDHPPSSWNLSIKSNESITLDIALPLSINSTSRTNLTFGNIEANRFSTNIIGKPINLHVDRVHTKEFLLKMNNTNDDDDDDMKSNNHQSQQLSDVIIGHVKSEKFQLNFTKSDKMHVYVYQVDSATAELYFDSSFCTNDSSLEINLNLSENGTIRYGNRTPIHIGPVFTRVHMLKHSCERNQPLLLYFDICQRQNPCTNNGTCVSIIPDYNDTSYTSSETGDIDYKCNCPLHTSGDHCQYLEYPFGFCLNGGTVYRTYDIYNKSVEKCLCPIGFYGDYCEENVDNCIGISCSNHGICEDGINAYHCSCYDGFYGSHCERKKVQTVILQAASRSFGIIAILLIFAIAGLVIASDIHTYITRKHERSIILNKLPRVTSEIFENSVLLLGFGDAPIEMNDLATNPIVQKRDKPKSRQIKRTTRNRKPPNSHRYIARRRRLVTLPKSSSGR
ncbi:unnamed protein product [Adineta steineri]|uniref:EGF-like domain-containing protein n=1 Tax=Adineta steineri TaxID=433720 RepID=A0A818LB52_9BILA|nr:unnamed protein product [Adineta steineri]